MSTQQKKSHVSDACLNEERCESSIPASKENWSFPSCEAAKERVRAMVSGEERGALCHVVPFYKMEIHDPFADAPPPVSFHSPYEVIFRSQVRALLERRWGHDEAVPMITHSVIKQDLIADAFGAVYHGAADGAIGTTPALHDAASIATLDFNTSLRDGHFEAALASTEYLLKRAGGRVTVQRHCIAGPTAAAGLILNSVALMEAFYTHPELVHKLLNKCTDLFIDFINECKGRFPSEVVLANLHQDTYWPSEFGVLCEDDTIVNLSPQMFVEFIVPCYNRIADAFNGILIHSCGEMSHLFPAMRDHVHKFRGIWTNAGECSVSKAMQAFAGTDAVVVTRRCLNTKYPYDSEADYVRKMLEMKPKDCSLYLQTSASDPLESEEIADLVGAFRESNTGRGSGLAQVKERFAAKRRKIDAASPVTTKAMDLPVTWKFRTDPKNEGEAAKWFEAETDGAWADIRVDESWTTQAPGKDYHGVAWYSAAFTSPPLPVGHRDVHLQFGAVDGYCWIWLDGKPVGSQLVAPAFMWNRPFAINLGGDAVKSGQTQRLVIKIHKFSHDAGIRKPIEFRVSK